MRWTRAWAWLPGALVAGLFLVAPPRASADPLGATLLYSVAPAAVGCPDESTLSQAVEAQLTGELSVSPGRTPEVAVAVHVTREAGVYRATVAVKRRGSTTTGVRTLEGGNASCDALTRAIVLAVAIALSSAVEAAEATSPGQSAGPGDAAAAQGTHGAEPSAPACAPAPASRSNVRLGVSLGGGVAFGAARVPVATGAFGLRLWAGHFAAELSGRVDAPAGDATRDFDTQLSSGVLAACVELVPDFEACGVLTLGILRATVDEGGAQRRRSAFWAASGLRLQATVPLGDTWFARARGTVLATIAEIDVISNTSTIWVSPPASGELGLDLGAYFL